MVSRMRMLPVIKRGIFSSFLQSPQIISRNPTNPILNSSFFASSSCFLNSFSTINKPNVIILNEDDLEESFVKGSGKGGQKINKVRNCVLLKHVPTGLLVRCQKTRSLDDNRRIARKLLKEKLDDHFNGQQSARNLKIQRLRKKKMNKKHKSKQKYNSITGNSKQQVEEEDSNDEDEDEDELEEDEQEEWEEIDIEQHKFKSNER